MINTHDKKPFLLSLLNAKSSSFIFLRFLNPQELENLYTSIVFDQNCQHYQQTTKITNLIQAFIFNKKYINKIDRTMFYFTYENNFVEQFDNISILNVAQNFTSQIKQNMQNFNTLFTLLNHACNMSKQQIDSFQMIVTNPDLPLPVNLRSTIGKNCNSTLQLYICSKANQNCTRFQEQTNFQNFKNLLSNNQEKYLKSILLSNKNNLTISKSTPIDKLRQLYFNPQRYIENMGYTIEDLIQDNQIYNFLAIIMKLSKNIINSIKIQLNSITDPYAKFMQFLLRYSVYKSYVLQVQEQLGFVYKMTQELIQDLFNINTLGNTNNDFSAWKLLTKLFTIQMKAQINKIMPTYINLIHKFKNLNTNEIYSQINLNQVLNFLPQFEIYQGSLILEHLTNGQNDDLQILLTDFVQMFVDLSIDEKSVLMCGHSQQNLGNLFQIYEDYFANYQSQILLKTKKQLRINLQSSIKEEIDFLLNKLNVKPRTLRNVIQQLNLGIVVEQFQAKDNQIVCLNKKIYKDWQQDLRSSQKSSLSVNTAYSYDQQCSDMDLQDLQYFSQMSQQQSYQEIDF